MSFRRILVAVDDSPVAARAAAAGLELAQSVGGETAFIHVIDPACCVAPDGGVPADRLLAQAEQDGKRLLSGFCQRAPTKPVPLEFLARGQPGPEVVKAAQDWPADVIVLGSHGRGGMARLLLGSVAEAVVRHAPCPVLVVRAHL